jgi:Rrf2 family protein
MGTLVSRQCEYALEAVLYLAKRRDEGWIHQKDIADALSIPSHFLGKILQLLSHHGIVTSFKGKTGGFRLAKDPREITPYDVIVAIEGSSFLESCVLGFPGCGNENPCPLHFKWVKIKEEILDMLKGENFEKLGRELDIKLDFIKNIYKEIGI